MRLGKMMVLDKLLDVIRTTTKDRVVIVSNFKQALDVIQTLCKIRSYRFLRLDGSTAKGQRQTLVDHFNDQTSDYCTIACLCRGYNLKNDPTINCIEQLSSYSQAKREM